MKKIPFYYLVLGVCFIYILFFYIIGGPLSATIALVIIIIGNIVGLIPWLIFRFLKRPRRKLAKVSKFIFINMFLLAILFILIYGGIYTYRFVSDKEKISPDDKYLVVMIADGASLIQARDLFMKGLPDKSNYLENISSAFPNISKYFIEGGAFTANGISVWPSSSIPAHTGITTGSYPRNTGVMGQRQFSPSQRKYTSYIGLGILQQPVILDKNIKSLCQYFPKSRSVDILQVSNRGCSLYVPGTPHDEQVLARTEQIVKFSSFYSSSGKNQIPKIVIMTLPDIDHQTHNSLLSDEKSINLYLKTDQYIGKIMDLYKKEGIFDRTLFVLAADHGMGEVKNHVTLDNIVSDMRFNTYKSLKWSLIPAWGSFEANFYVGTKKKFNTLYDSLALWGGNSDGLFYVKGQERDQDGNVVRESWDIKATDDVLANYHIGGTDINVIERLIEYSPGIGLVLTNPEESVFNIYSSLGQGQIRERKNDNKIEFSYQIIDGEDPLGFANNEAIKKYIENGDYLSDQEWIKLTYLEHYPDALRRIAYSFENKNSATIHLIAADGWDFTPYYVAKNVLVGSHGSLNSQQSLVPIMFHGPGIKNTEMPFARTVDILPTILKYFGISTNVDGRPLPVFEDEGKNNEVVNYGVSFSNDKNIADDKFYYALEDIYASYDKRIIRINKETLKEEVLLDSIKEFLPALNEKVNVTLKLEGFDSGTRELLLRKIYVAENREGEIFRFNVDSEKFI